MPWKEPGEKPREPRGQGPWGQGSGGPDLEAWLRNFRRRLGPLGHGPTGWLALVVLAIVVWLLIGGWVSIGAQQVGVLQRFGKFERVLQPGLHLRFPSPIDQVTRVNVGQVRGVSDEARLLTSDGQLVLVDYTLHYKITHVRDFLFAARDAEEVVRDAATAAARAAGGAHKLQCLLDELGTPCPSGHVCGDQLATAMLAQVQASLAGAQGSIGAEVTDVSIQHVSVPADVKPAFDAIAKAREDAKTAQVAARADVARDKIEAGDQAVSVKADAETYRRQVVADANAAAARFAKVLPEYQAAPQVTQQRLWLDAMHAVLTRNHVVVNTGSGNVIVQFPVQHPATPVGASSTALPSTAASVGPAPSASAALPVTSGPDVQGVY